VIWRCIHGFYPSTGLHLDSAFALAWRNNTNPRRKVEHIGVKCAAVLVFNTPLGKMDMAKFKVNGVEHDLDIEPDMPLLWAIRDELGMTGTKFGCGIASCGACTVHINGSAVRSCVLPVSAVEGQEVTTIEGLAYAAAGANLSAPSISAVQQAWIDHQVPQCGYCQSGMIMAVSSLLASNPNPSDAEIDAGITNVCRCGSYPRVRKAIRALASA
jgi:isoquinoline 1-oxidoreductase alpha subunit